MARRRLPAPRPSLRFEIGYRCLMLGHALTDACQDLGISRSLGATLMQEARSELDLKLGDGVSDDEALQAIVRSYLTENFGIEEVHVFGGPLIDADLVQAPEYRTVIRENIGRFAADVLRPTVPNSPVFHVAIGGGVSMEAFAQRFRPPAGTTFFRPLNVGGAWWRPHQYRTHASVLHALALRVDDSEREEASIRIINPGISPPLSDDAIDWDSHHELAAIFGDEPHPQLVVTGMGRVTYEPTAHRAPSPGTAYCVKLLAESNHCRHHARVIERDPRLIYEDIPDRTYEEANAWLCSEGIIGDFAGHAVDDHGNVSEKYFELTATRGAGVKTLQNWREKGSKTALVVASSLMTECVRAALRTRIFSTVVVDAALALALVRGERLPATLRRLARRATKNKE